jgi:hypothetical protein
MSKSVKARKNDKVKVKPRKSYLNDYAKEEMEKTIASVLKQKNDLKNFEEYVEE